MYRSIELRQKAKKLVDEAKAIVGNEPKELSEEERGQVDSLYAESQNLQKEAADLERRERLEVADAELKEVQPRKVSPSRIERRALDRDNAAELFRSWALAGTPGYRPTPDAILRASEFGFDPSNQVIQVRALSKGTASAGGYTVPQSFTTELEKILAYYFTVSSAVDEFSTEDGRDHLWPTVTDVSNSAALVAEAGSIATNVDPTFGQVTFKSFDYYSPTVVVSNQWLRDSSVSVPSLLAELFAERVGRAKDISVVSTNAGSSAPQGILNGVSAGVNLASGNALTYAKLLELETSVDAAYRNLPGTGFLMHDATWQAIRAIVDGNGRPMVNGDLQNGVEKKLLGYPVFISNRMTSHASPGDNAPLILFGALKKYKLRRVGGSTLTRLNELYAATGQVGFVLHEAWDGRWITTAGVKTLNSYDAP